MVETTQVTEEEGTGAITGSEGGASGAAGAGKKVVLTKKKTKRMISDIIVHVYASFNNTLITVTDVKGIPYRGQLQVVVVLEVRVKVHRLQVR